MIAVTGELGREQGARTLPFNRSSELLTPIDPDDKLLAALRSGDRMGAERLVSRYGDRAYRLAIGITRNAQDAEEAVQDAFWNVVRKIDMFRGESSLGSWIYRIVLNAAYQKLRIRARRRDDISLDEVLPAFDANGRHVASVEDWSAAVDDPAVQGELRTALEAAIGKLPIAYRSIILLHDVEGVPMAEVAESLAITLASAKTRAHRARLILRKRLSNALGSSEHPIRENKRS
jgi:RNA polymerase sigma-70 factor, ECF subfamily